MVHEAIPLSLSGPVCLKEVPTNNRTWDWLVSLCLSGASNVSFNCSHNPLYDTPYLTARKLLGYKRMYSLCHPCLASLLYTFSITLCYCCFSICIPPPQVAVSTCVAQEALSNVRTVRAFAMEDYEVDLYSRDLRTSQSYNERLGFGIAAFQALSNIAVNGAFVKFLYSITRTCL